jgi:hypothetical protein
LRSENKDGGISGCSKKNVPQSERFFDNRYSGVSLGIGMQRSIDLLDWKSGGDRVL